MPLERIRRPLPGVFPALAIYPATWPFEGLVGRSDRFLVLSYMYSFSVSR